MGELPYLWPAKGRKGRLYWFYRRDGRRVPITDEDGKRLRPGDPGFGGAYDRIHATYQTAPTVTTARTGTMAHLIEIYRKSPDFMDLAERTRKDYVWFLEILKRDHGPRSVAMLPREAVLKMRDDFKDTPRKANYLLSVLRLLLSYAEDRKGMFHLPQHWTNPARRPKRLKTGEGYRPWEEEEIDTFRKAFKIGTFERVIFETFLNTGQRSQSIAPMVRSQYRKGVIAVEQEKTKVRVWIPASNDLKAAIDPWLKSHDHLVIFPTPKRGMPLKKTHMQHIMRDAIRKAKLPESCALHGLRYTFSTRAIELGLDHQTIESIVGHKTLDMAIKYTEKRRNSRLVVAVMNRGLKKNVRATGVKTASDRSENRYKKGRAK